MVGIQWTLTQTQLRKLVDTFPSEVERIIRASASRIQTELVHMVPRDKYGRGEGPGRLQASFRAVPTRTSIVLKWGAAHAKYPEHGVAPHVMRDSVGISTPYGVFKKVNHPGQRPQKYRFNIAQAALKILMEELARELPLIAT